MTKTLFLAELAAFGVLSLFVSYGRPLGKYIERPLWLGNEFFSDPFSAKTAEFPPMERSGETPSKVKKRMKHNTHSYRHNKKKPLSKRGLEYAVFSAA
ncbi:hypothetical protein [Mailhella sp.]